MSTEHDIYKQKEKDLAPKDATPTGNPTTLNEVTARYIAERQREEANNAITQVGDVGGGSTTDGSGTTTTTDDKMDGGIVPTTPTTITTPYDKEVKDAQDNLAKWYSDYANKVAKDEEALKKKQKAARWITAAQMLGDSIAALGNSWATASGANAMALTPGAGKAGEATSQIEQDIRAARDRANKAQMDYAMNRYKMAVEGQQKGVDNYIKLGNLEISRQNLVNDAEYQKAMLDLRVRELEKNGVKADQAFQLALKEFGLKEKQLLLSEKELKARIDGSYYSGSGNGTTGKLDPVKTSQGDMLIDETKLNPTNLAQYAELANQSGNSELAKAIANLDGGTRSISALKQELGKILQDPANKAIVDHMVNNGILVTNTKSGQNNGGKILGLK